MVKTKTHSTRHLIQLEGSIMPEARFMTDLYSLALSRYQLAGKLAKGKVTLDAGCGAGYGAEMLANAGAKKVYGVDLAAPSIKYGREHHQHQNLIFRQGNIAKLDFPSDFFDLVVALEVIEHVEDYEQTIEEFYRVLKPKGLLVISTPNKAIYSPDSKKPFYPFHKHEFYLKDLKKMLRVFEIKEISGQFIRGRNMLIYGPLDPRRIIRFVYANLPIWAKIFISRTYLRFYSFLDHKKIYPAKKYSLSDVYFSNDLAKTRIFVALAEKK